MKISVVKSFTKTVKDEVLELRENLLNQNFFNEEKSNVDFESETITQKFINRDIIKKFISKIQKELAE